MDQKKPENPENPGPSGAVPDIPSVEDIHQRFHHQMRQHGHALLAFVANELKLQGPARGLSVTLERLDFFAKQANWVWMVGSADTATERAVLRFFQTEAGKDALVWRGEGNEFAFTLASTLLRLPVALVDAVPNNFTVAPLNGDKTDKAILTTPPHPVVPAQTSGWLQVAPHTEFSSVPAFSLQQSGGLSAAAADTILGAWLVDPGASTVHGHVAAVVGARGVLVAPIAEE